ncbi:MAG: DNA-binding protein [Mogibacterium sp.]|nr:DNA-binding protein [Mogibacterium sp.]
MGSYLGIDTSNYRTSVAVIGQDGNVKIQKAVLLEVPQGSRGLRQSEAFFRHSGRLPLYLEEIFKETDPADIKAIGVSDKPRRQEGSYMPCFMAGTNLAVSLGAAMKLPVFRFSHQEGHAAAVLPEDTGERVLFMHLSGGTTEFLLCEADEDGYSMEIVGGTKDIAVGQLIDRFGVASGLPFPSGPFLDSMAYEVLEKETFRDALKRKNTILPRIKINDGWFNLSGAETCLMRYDGGNTAEAAAELFVNTAKLLYYSAADLAGKYDINKVCMAGGVASSRTVRALTECLRKEGDPDIIFGDPVLSSDNAVGTARLAKRKYETRNSNTGK